ncbi:unnamed protein product [Urochloa humidicola]
MTGDLLLHGAAVVNLGLGLSVTRPSPIAPARFGTEDDLSRCGIPPSRAAPDQAPITTSGVATSARGVADLVLMFFY